MAKRCGRKIIIAGFVQDKNYFETKVKPLINDEDVVYAGNCAPKQRNELLGNALALLHLVHFDEPFGLSVAEAMCCGTPVIAFDRGSMPELIKDKTTGFLVNSIDEATQAVEKLHSISRIDCRQWACSSFSSEKMTEDYIEVYQRILRQTRHNEINCLTG